MAMRLRHLRSPTHSLEQPMRSIHAAASVLLLSLLLAGCSATPAPSAVKPPPSGKHLPAAASPTEEKKAADKPEDRSARRERPAVEKAKVAQLFQVPQFTLAAGPANQGDSRQGVGAAPQIRYLGFSRINGQLKALVQVKNEIIAVEQGDLIDGAEVVALDAEGVSFQYAGQRWTRRLFEKSESQPVVLARASSTPAIPEPVKNANGQTN
jgi:hypothetical protein